MSPTIKWKTLAQQEFVIPPKDKQRRIADILWAVDEAISQYDLGVDQFERLMRHYLTKLTTNGIGQTSYKETKIGYIPENWGVVNVEDILTMCQYGLSIPLEKDGEFPIFRMMNIENGVVVEKDMKYVDLPQNQFQEYQLEQGDILFNRTNSADLVGKVGIYRLSGKYVFASYLIRLRVRKDMVLSEYLNYYLNSDLGQQRIIAYATPGVSQTNINATNLKKVLVPLPPLSTQAQIVALLQQMECSKLSLDKHLLSLTKLKNRLLDKLLHQL